MMSSETRGDVFECEVGGYLVRALRADAWDAIVTLLVTLETEQHHYFHAVMQGAAACPTPGRRSTASTIC